MSKFEARERGTFQLTKIDGEAMLDRGFFKVKKGALHLIVGRSIVANTKADFSSKTMPVIDDKKQQ